VETISSRPPEHQPQMSFDGSDVAHLSMNHSTYSMASSSPITTSLQFTDDIMSPNENTSKMLKHLKAPPTQSTTLTDGVTSASKMTSFSDYDDQNDDDGNSTA
jgi:hypothetical protein